MKKLTVFIISLCATYLVHAQSPSDALGVRFDGGDGIAAEISYQKFIGGNNRLEFDLGFDDDGYYEGFKFSLLYHWVGEMGSGFYWYVGAGGSIGGWSHHHDHGPFDDDGYDEGFFLDADGQLGVEYEFPIPLQISLDLRPEFGLINDDFDARIGLGLRYRF